LSLQLSAQYKSKLAADGSKLIADCYSLTKTQRIVMRDFTKLAFWQRSHQLTLSIYKVTKQYPKEELFGLTSQMRRSSSSIPTNIAEGCGRNTNPQLKHFLEISTGSGSELQYQLILSKDLEYISEETFRNLHDEIVEIRKMIYSFGSQL
jgi:four helix bundle protein